MSGVSTQPEPPLNAQYVLGKLRANLALLFVVPVLLVVAVLLYTYLAQPVYKAEATLYFPRAQSSVLGSVGVASDSAGGISSLGGGPTPIKIFRRFLESETCLEFVAGKSGMSRKTIVDSRRFDEDPGASMLTLSVTLPDGQTAKTLLDEHLKALATLNERISGSYLADDTAAIDRELTTQKAKLDQAEKDLVEFQKGADSAPSSGSSQWQARLLQARVELASTRSSLQAASSVYRKSLGLNGLSPSDIPPVQKLRPRLIDAEYQLNILLSSLGPDAPEVRHLQSEIETLKSELQAEVAAYVSSINNGLIDPTSASSADNSKANGMLERQVALESEIDALQRLAKVAPSEQGMLAHLALQVSIESDLVKQATLQLEATKLQALRDPNKWSLLDPTWVDPKPVNKKYMQVSAAAFLAGLLLSSVWAFNFGRKPDLG